MREKPYKITIINCLGKVKREKSLLNPFFFLIIAEYKFFIPIFAHEDDTSD